MLQKVDVLPGLKTPEHSKWGISRAEQRDRIHNLLAMLPVVQPRIGWLSGLQEHIGLDFWRVDFGLLRAPIQDVPWEAALKNRGAQEGWTYFKEEILKT